MRRIRSFALSSLLRFEKEETNVKRIAIVCAFFVLIALLGCSLLGNDPPPNNPDDAVGAVVDTVDGIITDACTDANKQAALDQAVKVEKVYKVWKRRFVAVCELIKPVAKDSTKYCDEIKSILGLLENEKERLMQIHNRVCDDP